VTGLPEFKVSVDEHETVVTLNGRFIGRAWQEISPDGWAGGWWVCRYQEAPKPFPFETEAKQHLLGVMKMPLPDWAFPKTCCAHHGLICDVSDQDDACCGDCPVWKTKS